jgi:hypothetical protein
MRPPGHAVIVRSQREYVQHRRVAHLLEFRRVHQLGLRHRTRPKGHSGELKIGNFTLDSNGLLTDPTWRREKDGTTEYGPIDHVGRYASFAPQLGGSDGRPGTKARSTLSDQVPHSSERDIAFEDENALSAGGTASTKG